MRERGQPESHLVTILTMYRLFFCPSTLIFDTNTLTFFTEIVMLMTFCAGYKVEKQSKKAHKLFSDKSPPPACLGLIYIFRPFFFLLFLKPCWHFKLLKLVV